MTKFVQAVRFFSLDEARRILENHCGYEGPDVFNDEGEEPQGLLSIIPADLVPEEIFFRLFDAGKGTVIDVEVIHYSGFGPPADEHDYMGFAHRQEAYVLEGRRYFIDIKGCPLGARDLHHLEAQVLDRSHPFDRVALETRLSLPPNWDFEDLLDLINASQTTATRIDRILHQTAPETAPTRPS